MTRKTILVLGGAGNLGQSLRRHSKSPNNDEFHFPSRDALPLQKESEVRDFLNQLKPTAIINAAAWTNVERAETHQVEARYMNSTLPSTLISWSGESNTKFIHISTDYVFDGLKRDPYLENDTKSPISVYGASKSEGEDAIIATNNPNATVVRTSGLYGFTSNNFVMKVLKKAMAGEELSVVDDQQMSPTNADDLALFCLSLLEITELPRLIHFSNHGSTNWNEIARAVYDFVKKDPEMVRKIRSTDYQSSVRRPQQSRLGTLYPYLTNPFNRDWRDSLGNFLKEVVNG